MESEKPEIFCNFVFTSQRIGSVFGWPEIMLGHMTAVAELNLKQID